LQKDKALFFESDLLAKGILFQVINGPYLPVEIGERE